MADENGAEGAEQETVVDRGVDASVDRAFEKAFPAAEEAPVAEAAEEAAPEGPARGPDGRFAPKAADTEPEPLAAPEAAPAPVEAPAWLNDANAKAAWGTAPAPLRDHLAVRFSEMERGLNEYRARLEPLRQFDEMARAKGQNLADVVQTYVGIEDQLRADPIAGLNIVCQNLGFDLRQVAAHVMGQPYDGNADAQQVRQQNAELQQELLQLRAFKQQADERTYNDSLTKVQAFAAEHPRYPELEHTIGWALQTGAVQRTGDPAADLQRAYEFAERLAPAPAMAATPIPPAAAPAEPVAARTRRTGISIEGAPGSNPGKPRPRNADEAVDRAFDQVGL
jgi:hypothetical protein